MNLHKLFREICTSGYRSICSVSPRYFQDVINLHLQKGFTSVLSITMEMINLPT